MRGEGSKRGFQKSADAFSFSYNLILKTQYLSVLSDLSKQFLEFVQEVLASKKSLSSLLRSVFSFGSTTGLKCDVQTVILKYVLSETFQDQIFTVCSPPISVVQPKNASRFYPYHDKELSLCELIIVAINMSY